MAVSSSKFSERHGEEKYRGALFVSSMVAIIVWEDRYTCGCLDPVRFQFATA